MGIFDWILGKEEIQRYVITTESGSTFAIERTRNGVWKLDRGKKGKAVIISIGSTPAERVKELTKRDINKMILFTNSKGGTNYTTSIKTIAKL